MRSSICYFYSSLLVASTALFFVSADRGNTNLRQIVLELGRQNAEHQECVDNMYLSDVNGDFLLSEDEYTLFIARESEGRVLAENYRDLPFSLITHFVYGACFCSIIFQTPNCCVGSEAQIELNPNLSDLIEENLVTICKSVGDAIDDAVGPAPTSAPVDIPTNPFPTSPPVPAPTEAPVPAPTSPPVPAPTDAPVPAPTSPPTRSPTVSPTVAPTVAPTLPPVPAPTLAPTPLPTNATASPTIVPSSSPSGSPVVLASAAPTVLASVAPTVVASMSPSASPTAAPTMMPVPTSSPTPEGLSCVSFQYGIGNSDGFTADDIFNEVGNTLKTGLIIATENVTIETLNATYPRDGRRMAQRGHKDNALDTSTNHFYIADLAQFESISGSGTRAFDALFSGTSNEVKHAHRRAAFLPSLLKNDAMDNQRRLVFYTDEFEPVINSMFPNPLCDDVPEFECAIVDTTVCVILEEGDDEQEVRTNLLAGIEQSIMDGSFQAAIPPENQLPGGIS